MHYKSLLHVRDHSKAVGRAHHLLEYIAQHVNMHTGEAFDLSVERLTYRLDVTPQWVRQLRTRLVETGELIVKMSRGRHCNVYVIPYESCPACQGGNPKVALPVDPIPDETNPKVPPSQPETFPPLTRKWLRPNPKLSRCQPESLSAPTRNCESPSPQFWRGASLGKIFIKKRKRKKRAQPETILTYAWKRRSGRAPTGVTPTDFATAKS